MESPDDMQQRWDKAIADAGAMTESEMREATVPRINTPEELAAYIALLVKRPHDYGTCVYAMSMAAVAAFNYVAHELGVTGFQASCADMDILSRTRGMKGPWMITNGEDLLFPQYDVRQRLEDFIEKQKPWAATEAAKKIAENDHAHPDVLAHWQKLATPS